jgi:hypothetical protein
MTISSTISRWESVGNGSTTIFPYTNKIFDDTDLNVYIDGVLQTLTTHYTVSGAGAEAGGNVTFVTAPANGASVVIVRNVANTQLIDFPAGGAFPSVSSEDGLDRRTIISQQHSNSLTRTLRYNEADGSLPSGVLPTLSTLKGRYLRFNSSTGAPEAGVFDTGIASRVIDSFAGDGSTTGFTLSSGAVTGTTLDVYVSGLRQFAGTWSVSGTALTFTSAPPPPPSGVTNNIEVLISETVPIGETSAGLVAYTPAPTGAVTSTAQAKLREFISVKDFGAVGDGVANDTTKFQAAIDSGATPVFVPAGNYIATTGSLTGQDRSTGAAFIGLGSTINGADQKHGLRGWHFGTDGIYAENYDLWLNDGFSTGVNDQLTNAMILVTAQTEDSSPLDGTKAKIGYSSTVRALGAQHADGARFNLLNSSSDGNGNTGVYCQAVAGPLANWSAAVHGETRHEGGTSIGISSENASYANVGSFYGMVLNNTTAGAPDGTPHAITGTTATVKHDTATALLMSGTAGSDKGEWRYGIRFRDGSLRAADGEGIRFEDEALYQIHGTSAAVSATADIYLQGDSATGIILGGTYTSGNALRVNAGQAIAWEGTGSAKTYYDSGTSQLRTRIAGTDRIALEIDPSPRLLLNSTQVLRERITGWGAPTGTATRTTFATSSVTLSQLAERVHALIDDLTTHGLIGA